MDRQVFLKWFFTIIVILGIGAVGASLLAIFKIDSDLYFYGFGFLSVSYIAYKIFKK